MKKNEHFICVKLGCKSTLATTSYTGNHWQWGKQNDSRFNHYCNEVV